jgi:DNA-binding MarR family transcriptional regulator
MSNPLELHEHDDQQLAVGEKRLKILYELAENGRAGTKAVDAVARDLEIHRSTVSDLMPTA